MYTYIPDLGLVRHVELVSARVVAVEHHDVAPLVRGLVVAPHRGDAPAVDVARDHDVLPGRVPYMCISYVCIYIYIYTHIYSVYIYIYMYIYHVLYACVYIYIYTHVEREIYTCVYIYIEREI